MSEKVAIKKSTLEAIGDAVRGKDGSTDLIPVNALPDRITALPTPSGENKFAQLVSGIPTELTASDLQGATKIGEYAFYCNTSLIGITIPNGVTVIEKSAFASTQVLKNVTFPNSLIEIRDTAFNGAVALEDIVLPNSLTSLGKNVFNNAKLTSITLSNSLTTVSYACFRDCPNLKTINFGSDVQTLSDYSFKGCTSLENVTIPNNVKVIGTQAFSGCINLTNVTIGTGVTSIHSSGLTCGSETNKATFTFLGETPPTIYGGNMSSFSLSRIEKILVRKGCGDTYKSATNWATLADYIEEMAE